MKNILACFLIFVLSIWGSAAQNSSDSKRSTLGLHFFYNDFKSAQLINTTSLSNVLKNKLWNKPQNMEGGFGIDYIHGLNKNIDFIGTLNGSWIDYLLPGNTLYGSSNFFMDLSTGAHLKMLSDNHIFSPFLIAKANYSSYQNIHGFSFAPGAGLQVNLFKEVFVIATVEYRAALSHHLSNQLYYSVGIATSIGKKRVSPAKLIIPLVSEPVKKEAVKLAKDFVVSVMDEASGQPLPFVAVSISGTDGKMRYGSTDEYGRVTFIALNPEEYTVSGSLNQINSTVKNIKPENFAGVENQIEISLTHNDPRFTLSGLVINKTENMPEGGAEVNVTNQNDNVITSIQSHPGDGLFRTQLKADCDFILVGKKANFISNIEKVTTKGLNRSTTLYVKLELAIEEAKKGQSIQLNNIYFEVGKANLNTAVSSDLDKLIRFLRDNLEVHLEIQGHTDSKGSVNLNNRLSQLRASSVVAYLSKNGIDVNRLVAKGYGSSLPVAENSSAEGRAKNRRVVMKVLK